jgi:hypothetical protein
MMHTPKLILPFGLTLLATGLHAQTLATYGGDYVTANSVLQGNSDAGIGNNQFSPTTQRQPAVGYTGPVFYAGVGLTGSPTISSNNTNVLQHVSGFDPIQIGLSGGTAARSLHGVILFDVASWDPSNTDLSLSVRGLVSIVGPAYGSDSVRFVVRSGSDYFVSATSGVFGIAGSTFTLGTTTAASNWLTYTPESAINGGFGSNPLTSLSGISAVGIYFNVEQVAQATSTSLRPQIYEFSAVAVVPEPSVFGFLAGAFALVFAGARRRRS